MSHQRNVGIDFGTTNSTIAVADSPIAAHLGATTPTVVRVPSFPFLGSVVETFRSVLYFENDTDNAATKSAAPLAGPKAIERYLEPHEGGRLIQSLKSFAASSVFSRTQIGRRHYTLEELIGVFLRILRSSGEAQLGPLGKRAVVGRPVRFVGATTPQDEARALTRLRKAYALAGFDEVEFAYEPIGAAYSYAQRLAVPELVLIADFGGGTSDFSVVQLHPGAVEHSIVATGGVPIGGDTFDARMIRNLVSPALGAGGVYRSLGKTLPMPDSLYRKLESWHHLSFLRSSENLRTLHNLRAQSAEPDRIQHFIEIVESDLGYHLHRAVQKTKVELSYNETAEFIFTGASTDLHAKVHRSQFESWIERDLAEIGECVDSLVRSSGTAPARIDRVFLTGGSSLLPVLRRSFAAKFGREKIASGDEFTSIARGLALIPRSAGGHL